MRKLKKLTLKKEVIVRVSDNQMAHLKGGYGDGMSDYLCTEWGTCKVSNCYGTCIDTCATCPGQTCFECPEDSQVGSGCDAETCGTAWTCNGR